MHVSAHFLKQQVCLFIRAGDLGCANSRIIITPQRYDRGGSGCKRLQGLFVVGYLRVQAADLVGAGGLRSRRLNWQRAGADQSGTREGNRQAIELGGERGLGLLPDLHRALANVRLLGIR